MVALRLHEMTSPEIGALVDQGGVVIVPVGAMEQHGPHLPVQTDFALARDVAERAAERAFSLGVPVAVAPPIWTGYSPHHMRFPGTISLRASTITALLVDVGASLWTHGFRKILFLNGHGGNSNVVGIAAQTLRYEHGVRVATANYWSFASAEIDDWRVSPEGGINHACEMEMSLALAAFPELCKPELARNSEINLSSPYFSADLMSGAPVSTPWMFDELSEDGTIGCPEQADQERGRELLDIIVLHLSEFLQEMSTWDWDDPKSVARGASR